MDTHKNLMIAVIVLAVVHAMLSMFVLSKKDSLSKEHMNMFLVVSIIVCLIIAALAGYCMTM